MPDSQDQGFPEQVSKLLLLKAKRPTFSRQATQSRHGDSTLSLQLESSQAVGERTSVPGLQ